MHEWTGSQDYNSPSDHKFFEFLMLTTSVSYITKALHNCKVHKKLQYILYCTLPKFVVSTFHHFIALFPAQTAPIATPLHGKLPNSKLEVVPQRTWMRPLWLFWGFFLKNFIIAIIVIIVNDIYLGNNCHWKYYSFPCYWHNFTVYYDIKCGSGYLI